MFFVVPFCAKDEWLALRLMTYCRGLESRQPYNCLVVHDDLISGQAVVEAAREYFAEVKEFTYKHWNGKPNWPYPQNFQFQNAAAHIYKNEPLGREPWFWWEPDATPVKAGWMKALDDRYEEGKRPFAGHIVSGTPFPGRPAMRWMTGCGIYPWNTPVLSPQMMLALQYPWDVASARDVIPNCTQSNDLIQHVWERDGKPFSFVDKDEAKAALSPTAVIFHRCKDGSLIDVLSNESWMEKIKRKVGLAPDEKKPSIAVLCLGRYGDIMNALPIAYFLHKTHGEPIGFIVSEDCKDILDGCSYVRPIVFRGHYSDVDGALNAFKGGFSDVLIAQMYGNHHVTRSHSCFLKDAYAACGMLPWYGRLRLVFDNRSRSREKALVRQFAKTSKHTILVNLSGLSSPFHDAGALWTDIQRRWGTAMNVVDISGIKAERVYDLLGLFDHSDVLVTTDTSTLHLARASGVRVVALQADTPDPWYGSEAPHAAATVRYNEWLERREEIHSLIHSIRPANKPFYYHVYPDFIGSGDSRRRNELAIRSWEAPYASNRFRPVPVHDRQLRRMWTGDPNKQMPFLKDVVEHAAWMTGFKDWILLTNTDTCFSPDIAERMDIDLEGKDCGYSHRRDFARLDELLTKEQIAAGHRYCGKDLFVFRRSWWDKNRDKMPDMIYGAEGWDALLSILIDESGGKVWDDLIYHERHGSYWESSTNRYSVPSQHHCLRLARQFCKDHNINPEVHGIK
jgi:hypothetical protein